MTAIKSGELEAKIVGKAYRIKRKELVLGGVNNSTILGRVRSWELGVGSWEDRK